VEKKKQKPSQKITLGWDKVRIKDEQCDGKEKNNDAIDGTAFVRLPSELRYG